MRGVICLPGVWCPDKMLWWWMQRGKKPCQEHKADTDRGKHTPGGDRRWGSDERGKSREASRGGLFTSPQSCARTTLPVSPDKAAVLLLLARNECVGVSSLFTTLLSQGLSCRRRAKCHHISKRLGTLFPGPRGCSTSCLIPPQSGSLRQPGGFSREDVWP